MTGSVREVEETAHELEEEEEEVVVVVVVGRAFVLEEGEEGEIEVLERIGVESSSM